MDILISSNLERLIYKIAGEDASVNAAMMKSLSADGKYTITDDMRAKLGDFFGGYATETETIEIIKHIYENCSYVIDTHTAVASCVYEQYKKASGDVDTKTVIASTASPYKFSAAVLEALEKGNSDIDEYAKVDRIAELSDIPVPAALADLKNKPERFTDVIEKADQKDYVLRTLGF
jgi:threonine synthase